MSNVHVASAANEVAQALPSTATVTVSKHGIQAIETLNLDAQTFTEKSMTWSRTFSGMEILTNPILQYRTKTEFQTADAIADDKLFDFAKKVKKSIRPRSDPISNAASSVNVTINNASMAIQPARDHRLVNTTYPDEPVVGNQRAHYGLNQLDEWAEPYEREFSRLTDDDVEFQFNNNALRQNYPSRLYGRKSDTAGEDTNFLLDDQLLVTTITYTGTGGGAGGGTVVSVPQSLGQRVFISDVEVGFIDTQAAGNSTNTVVTVIVQKSAGPPALISELPEGTTISDVEVFESDGTTPTDGLIVTGIKQFYASGFTPATITPSTPPGSDPQVCPFNEATALEAQFFTLVYDISQPLAHPYFRDNVMRDNTLVNVRYFDCQITLNDIGKIVEANHLWDGTTDYPKTTTYTTELVKADFPAQSFNPATGASIDAKTKAFTPRLIFDLVTPSVPLPTISDKVVSTFHTMTSPPQAMVNNKLASVKSGNIQLSQIPDKIYVFLKSSLMDSKATTLQSLPSTRLGVCTNLRIRTPQNSAFLIEMDQESLYQMSCRNGSKQSRSAFMCTLGSVVCIDPEKDLGGYTNGVLLPYTFDVQADFTMPGVSGTDSIVWRSDVDSKQRGRPLLGASEQWTLFVVCELHGHLYLMSDGTGKQTKSNLTVTEVADAVAEGLQHPATIGNGARSQKMDAGVLAEVARAGDSRDALRS